MKKAEIVVIADMLTANCSGVWSNLSEDNAKQSIP